MRIIFFILFISIGTVFILYLSWLPQPRLGTSGLVPDWMAAWVDATENDKTRTGVPFIFIGMAAGWWMFRKSCSWRCWIWAWLGMVAVVLIAETGQVFLPHRSFDWYDIAWGATGAMLGLAAAQLSIYILNKLDFF